MSLESDIARLNIQEERLRFSSFDRNAAWKLGENIKRLSEELSIALAIEVRLVKETVFFHSMQGTTTNNIEWVRRKRNTVELMHRSSYAIGLIEEQEGISLQQKMGISLQDYATHGGAFPIFVNGIGCIGVVTVSGVPERQDHAIVAQALSIMCGLDYSTIALD